MFFQLKFCDSVITERGNSISSYIIHIYIHTYRPSRVFESKSAVATIMGSRTMCSSYGWPAYASNLPWLLHDLVQIELQV